MPFIRPLKRFSVRPPVAAPPPPPPPPPAPLGGLYTPPSGTALVNVHPEVAVGRGEYVKAVVAFRNGDLAESDVDNLFYVYTNGGSSSYVQADNYTLWDPDAATKYVSLATCWLHSPTDLAWPLGGKLTIFKSATETKPSNPTYSMSDSTFAVKLSAYTPDISFILTKGTPDDSTKFVVTLSASDGTHETYEASATAGDYAALYAIAQKIHGSAGSKYRIGKWNAYNAYQATMPDYGVGSDIGDGNKVYHDGYWSGYNSAYSTYWQQPRMTVFQKAIAQNTDPLIVSAEITVPIGSAAGTTSVRVRTKENRATYTATWDSLTTVEGWFSGKLVKEEWRRGRPTNGGNHWKGTTVRMCLTRDRNNNVIRRQTLFENGDVTLTGRDEAHYDVRVSGSGMTAFELTDVIHTPYHNWHWPLTEENLVLMEKDHLIASRHMPVLDNSYYTYEGCAQQTMLLRGVQDGRGTGFMITESEIGMPLFRAAFPLDWSAGGGIAEGPWISNQGAIAWHNYSASAVRWACAREGNSWGCQANKAFDNTGTGIFANGGPVDPYDTTKRLWEMNREGANFMHSQGVFQTGHSGFILRGHFANRKFSHVVGLGWFAYLMTGEYRYFVNLECNAQEAMLTGPAYYRRNITTSNSAFSTNNVYVNVDFNNGVRSGTKVMDVGKVALYVPYNHRRYDFWRNCAANMADALSNNTRAAGGFGVPSPILYTDPITGAWAIPAQAYTSGGGFDAYHAVQTWNWAYVAMGIGTLSMAGLKEYQEPVDQFAKFREYIASAPAVLDGDSAVSFLAAMNSFDICFHELDTSVQPRAHYQNDVSACWAEWSASPVMNYWKTGVNDIRLSSHAFGGLNQWHNYPVLHWAGLKILSYAASSATDRAQLSAICEYAMPYYQAYKTAWMDQCRFPLT